VSLGVLSSILDLEMLGLAALAIAMMSTLYLLLWRRMRLYNLAAGSMVCWSILLVLSSLFFPGAIWGVWHYPAILAGYLPNEHSSWV
jgi:hypothetical protein